MPPRDPGEHHRAATTLELLFDLVFVIAIASAAAGLHHALSEGHATDGILRFALAFFAIFWGWLNFTWFASAYDNDDALFRVLTMVIMAGALVVAASIPQLFAALDIRATILGYVIMRLGMIGHWLRAARDDTAHRRTALGYAKGIALVQLYWIALYWLSPAHVVLFHLAFVLGALLEMSVPAIAERHGMSPWHRHHIIERYGLLTIIVLGEGLLAAAMALQQTTAGHFEPRLIPLALSALVIVFMMWWIYFAQDDHLNRPHLRHALLWGYGHSLIFAGAAAVGAGFAVSIDTLTHHGHASLTTARAAIALPLALYLAMLWVVRDRTCLTGPGLWLLPVAALAILATLLTPWPVELMAALMIATVALRPLARRI